MWRGPHTERFSAFPLEAKVAVVLFFAAGLLGIVYGTRGFFFNLKKPFLAQMNYSGPRYLSLAEQEAKEIEEQKSRDTDEDGINDYEELAVYHTSPYLSDTDSDGVDDAAEIRLGKDPSCPEGQNCLRAFASAAEEGEQPELKLPGTESPLDLSSVTSAADLQGKIERMSVGDLRRVLVQTGISADIIDGLSDSEVRTLFVMTAQDPNSAAAIEEILANLPEEETESP
jgi:hypothetical protein